MPDLDGIGLMRRMRDDMRFSQVPVMLITSNAQKEVVMEAAQLGLGGMVIKPVDTEQTKARIIPVIRNFLESVLQKPEKLRRALNLSEERHLRTLAAFFSQLDQVIEELDGMKGKGKQTLPLFEAKLETLKQNAATIGSPYLRQVLERVHKRVNTEGDPEGICKNTVALSKSLLRDYVTWMDLPVARYETTRAAA
jgi:CheY-like chemotaxis protein